MSYVPKSRQQRDENPTSTKPRGNDPSKGPPTKNTSDAKQKPEVKKAEAAPPPTKQSATPPVAAPAAVESKPAVTSVAEEPKAPEPEEQQRQEEEQLKKLEEERKEKLALRQINSTVPASRSPAVLKSLDSSIKRNTSFIKKLKTISEDQRDSLLQELNLLNLSKFLSEVVAAIAEAKLKPTDVGLAVKICSQLHQRYTDFSNQLIPALTRYFAKQPAPETEQEKNSKFIKKRTTLRLLAELYVCGIFSEVDVLQKILQDTASLEQLKADRDGTYFNLSLIVSFCRTSGEDLLGMRSKKLRNSNAGEQWDGIVPLEQQKPFYNILDNYWDMISRQLVHEQKELRAKERENHHILETKGELSEANSATYDKLRKSFEKLLTNMTSLADILNKDMPALPEDVHTTRIESGAAAPAPVVTKEQTHDSIFDDDDTRTFYENLPELRVLVPGVLLGDDSTKDKDKEKETATEENNKAEIKEPEKPKEEPKKEEPKKEEPKKEEPKKEEPKKEEPKKEESKKEEPKKEEPKDKLKSAEPEKETAGPAALALDDLLARLTNCVNRDLIDQAAIDFCYQNSKNNRKKLVKALFGVPRTQLALIPYYSRMVATLNQYMRDIGPSLVAMLEEEFQYLYHKKDQINIENKIRNIRFMGELTKFKICPANQTLSCLKMCLDDFVHHNIDIACNLLETCGRFLYRSPETHVRTKNLLEMMMRLKNTQNLQSRLETMVENAFYQCIPPENQAKKVKEEPPLKQYVRKLIYGDLNKNTAKYVLKQLRKLPWKDPQIELFTIKCLVRIYKGRYNNVHLVASIISGLATYHEIIGVRIVDELLESIRASLEHADYTQQQRQITNIKFLGELYNYCVIESAVVFDTLYGLINTPITRPGEADHSVASTGVPPAPIGVTTSDTSTDFFRIRLACTLLDTCGQYFDRGSSKRKLDRYLTFFQRYILSKPLIPMDVEFAISDSLEVLRPQLIRYETFDQAAEEVAKIEREEHANQIRVASTSTPNKTESESDSEESEGDEVVDEEDDEEGEDEEVEEERELEDDDDEGDDGEDDEDSYRRDTLGGNKEEDDEFDRELKKMIQESVEARKFEARNTRIDMAIPMGLFKTTGIRGREEDAATNATGKDESEQGKVAFRVLMKKGNKQTTRNVDIPMDYSLASNTVSKQTSEKEEQQVLKRIVLEYGEREEEEHLEQMNHEAELAIQRSARGRSSRGGPIGGVRVIRDNRRGRKKF
eukprot:TRINITY_DN2050_c0_g1_i2.p1 TRINITY_DN2050_c0_g1~~TRINITY_DN2050_c0_g1_i2.p1  ORF type:complete len:1232 (-),score=430.22 TRINITY_DN2050_c0_g1_i2:182-3877(-)